MKRPEFRLGTTSYILPDDILPNVRFLAGQVQDIELVLFEVDDGQNNLPDLQTIQTLREISNRQDLTYTIHLPLDLRMGSDGDEQHISLFKARRVIECTRPLEPWAYVLHLDAREVRNSTDPTELQRWQDQACRALEKTAEWVGSPTLLAVENLESYPLDFWEPIFKRVPVSRCVDIGHLWLGGHDPIPYLERALPRTRVIHIHGIGERDHQSLSRMDPEELERVLDYLIAKKYSGVLTMELFGLHDFESSLETVKSLLKRQEITGE
ncbi:MAG TPA: cobamide remodeling phosphodiesterase CbiR [Anaerolineaceae bacterium]|nr:cobamide remodeling phosphodiesterase CbiR [Anaerolineaceae bacterium]